MKKIILYLMMIFIFFPKTILAVGIISDPIRIDNTLKGEVAEKTLIILNPGNKEEVLRLAASGEIASWIKFFENRETVMPISKLSIPARSKKNISVRFVVPENAEPKPYQGMIRIIQVSKETSKKIDQPFKINVTKNEKIRFDTKIMPKNNYFDSDNPFELRIIYENKGNVSVMPQTKLQIYNSDKNIVFDEEYPFPKDEPIISPGSAREIPAIKIPIESLATDRYKGKISFAFKDYSTSQEFNFDIKNNSKPPVKISSAFILGIVSIAALGGGVKFLLKKYKNKS